MTNSAIQEFIEHLSEEPFIAQMTFSTEKREELKEKGQAMPHGEYPIRNRGDLKRAIQAFGRAKDKVKTKAWIIKRAKELNAVDLLPEDWVKVNHSTKTQEFIDHYGTKGMRWGVRKPRGDRSAFKKKAKAAATSDKGEKRDKERTVFGKSPQRLTNAQLEARIKRMDMEKRYNDLNKRDVSKGEQIATEIITNVGKQVITNIATSTLTGLGSYGVKKVLERKTKLPVSEIFKKK